jgi:asparagine synthase (glutamine-hydrolysing)
MCGIAGEWDWSGVPRAQSVIATMIDTLAHRGPEGRTCWFSPDGKLALAHAQLSFFKGAEAQPVSNRRNTIFVVCNGEIYNYRDLAQVVHRSGISCDFRSDVEVIPYLYELRGLSSFALLRGEFAFALYDSVSQSLYLVRDRFGIKPLYYHSTGSSVVFASEVKALFGNPRVPRILDSASLATKLFGITFPGSTAFSTIREVKPGSYLEVGTTRISEQPYWSLRLEPAERPVDPGALAHNFLDLFDEAVRVRLHGDYPIGAYLSGGIDSSAVLSSMVHSGARSIKAFTVSFEDKLLDEGQAALNTASRLGVEHHILRVRDRDLSENFLHSIWHSEIPVINTHGTAKFLLSRAAHVHVKGIMTGEGADELFAGYPYFAPDERAGRASGIRLQFANWYHLFASRQFASDLLPIPREKDINRLIALFGCAPYLGRRALFYARFIRAQLNRDFLRYFSPLGALQLLAEELRPVKVRTMTPVNVDRFLALTYDLPAYHLNFLADRQEMAHAIEGRVPFLDNNVVAFATALRGEALIGEGAGKTLIRRAFAKRLPPETLISRKKIFLSPPTAVDDIFRSEWAYHLLSRAVTDAVGVFDWRKLTLLRTGLKVIPASSGAGTALRTALTLIVSLHALHHLFIVGRSRS